MYLEAAPKRTVNAASAQLLGTEFGFRKQHTRLRTGIGLSMAVLELCPSVQVHQTILRTPGTH